MLDVVGLRRAYTRYGFEEAPSGNVHVYVFTLKAGHYHNADIIPIDSLGTEHQERIFDQFKESGFACKIRKYNDINEVKKTLFQGFFSVDNTHRRLLREYNKFTASIISVHSDDATYEYIKSSYYINDKIGTSSVIDEIVSRMNSDSPILFLIEAAAGFGKTCTAYELLKEITNNHKDKVPLFTELSRNRQAKIFRYVLLDEIDRSFPLLSSNLVKAEIRNGNVPVILDGFDELLHQSDDSTAFDTTEPMLETIGELLIDKAKVILTTRRTSILDGDDFHDWMLRHQKEFEVVRIKIENPTIDNWLSKERLDILKEKSFPINNLCNPVLLSYLRCIKDDDFKNATNSPDQLVDKYFTSMLERERTRQDLLMSPTEQYNTLKHIAADMMQYDYTAESKEYIASVIQDYFNDGSLERIRKLYPADQRPTSDEIINKITSHALLDRSTDVSSNIGFVNDFVLGNYCSDLIIEEPHNEWCGSRVFIEPATLSFMPRSIEKKKVFWNAIKFAIELGESSDKFINSIRLNNEMLMDVDSETIDKINIRDVNLFNKSIIKNSVFTECIFQNIIFHPGNMSNISFVDCSFFDCSLESDIQHGSIYDFGGIDNNGFLEKIKNNSLDTDTPEQENEFSQCDLYILGKFWPIGNSAIYKHRPTKVLYVKNNYFSYEDIIKSVASLRKRRVIMDADKNGIIEFNMDMVAKIKLLLGR